MESGEEMPFPFTLMPRWMIRMTRGGTEGSGLAEDDEEESIVNGRRLRREVGHKTIL